MRGVWPTAAATPLANVHGLDLLALFSELDSCHPNEGGGDASKAQASLRCEHG